MRRLFLLIALICVLHTESASACSCITSNEAVKGFDFNQWLAHLDGAMFTGRVLNIEKVDERFEDGGVMQRLKVTFGIERYWKGVERRQAIIYTGLGGGDCGVPYAVGEKFFVIAYTRNGKLATDICTAPGKYNEVKYYEKQLGKGIRPK